MRYSFECPPENFRWFTDIRSRCGSPVDSLLIGGLARRRGAEARSWLESRKSAGIGMVIASFAGPGAMHDFWNGRTGDFDHLLEMLRQAEAVGLAREERIFVTKGSLSAMSELLQHLDGLPGVPKRRRLFLFMYRGKAAHLEAERPEEADRDAMPAGLRTLADTFANWRSEREWMDAVRASEPVARPRMLHIGLTETNLPDLERMTCDELIADLMERTRKAYAALPSVRELCDLVGDAKNRKVYAGVDDVARLWLDRWQEKTGAVCERSLTDYSTW
jgi:hypothetical protein